MNYYDNKENKIRRRKVSSNNKSLKNNKNDVFYKKNTDNGNINTDNGNIKIENSTIYREERSISSRVRNKKKSKYKRFIKSILILMLSALVVASSVGAVFIISAIKGAKPVTEQLLQEHYISSEVVSGDQIPRDLKNAIVSIEDERFYDHKGIDYISLLRSVLHNIFTDTTQGGSTIEMQLSKNLLTNDDKTIKRKLRDMYNAISMDKHMSKDKILDAYLNNIYLGRSSYGVSKGSKKYFGKNVSELNLAECAMLAGITNNPGIYSEFTEAKKRQKIILYKMNELGYITDEEYEDALAEKVFFISEIG